MGWCAETPSVSGASTHSAVSAHLEAACPTEIWCRRAEWADRLICRETHGILSVHERSAHEKQALKEMGA